MSIVQIGVTAAIKADDIRNLPQPEIASLVRDLGEQLIPKLREYVGDAQPEADPAVNLQGPEDDALQGPIYAISMAAPFDTTKLPATCKAYETYVLERNQS